MLKILVITPTKHINNFQKNINKIGKAFYLDDPTPTQLKKIISRYDIIFTNPNKSQIYLGKDIIDNSDRLKIICTASTGTNHIDLKYVKSKNIKVISLTKDLKTIKKISSTAELALTLLLCCIRNIIPAYKSVIDGMWDYSPFIGRQLDNLVIGIIGYGRLGKIFSKLCINFGCKIIVYDPYVRVKNKKIHQVTSLSNLVKLSDIISIHVHANEKNINLINIKSFSIMKKNVTLINTSRGEIVNEVELLKFLKNNPESKYGTDVVSKEIIDRESSPIIKYAKKNNQIVITPHIGGMTSDGQEIAYNAALVLLKKYIKKAISKNG